MTLTEKQLAELVSAIHRRRNVLEDELQADAASPADMSEADAADSRRDLAELHELEGAEGRIAEGTYGACTDCGALIPYDRLRAAPHAARCVACQGRHERAHPAAQPTL